MVKYHVTVGWDGVYGLHMVVCHVIGWDSVYGFNMSSIRKVALKEPLVDVVESHQIVTDSVLLKVSVIYCVGGQE